MGFLFPGISNSMSQVLPPLGMIRDAFNKVPGYTEATSALGKTLEPVTKPIDEFLNPLLGQAFAPLGGTVARRRAEAEDLTAEVTASGQRKVKQAESLLGNRWEG